ncbi:NADP-dependent malic enzyme [Sphingosinicella microcystinivorans]|uniref:Allosteric NADP-dependent malic enzyme n=1 Tax=Sphingosinicella microcystinivorans TaxID=335406 RepID=A0AAD1D3P9_SPHMI|nr:NADP-dependent malic enzyme [Sphingosinicella microcystinivorans]RKS85524.1 allosteric NADP-dependent malic enzyme [Sphingosinicella microcystinivorans]BBE33186.1 malic protein NAD-binding protein [Sphingosinicella microcystinivorans]
MSKGSSIKFSDQEALQFHSQGRPGKIEIISSKPMATQRDLSLAYSPGVAVPVEAIAADPVLAYDYTAKGNLVAVISNGTAILGLGNLGALASKPVMEGKAVLFKRFADVDAIDIELASEDVDALVSAISLMEPSFGGINLEDIASPDCFIIESRLREMMNIPVFHDDQHGTAIISAAGLINALRITGKSIKDVKMVVNGAGAAAIACAELIIAMGMPRTNVRMCDREGVIHKDRQNLNQWKSAYAIETEERTLLDAMQGADVFLGLSAAGALSPEMVKAMAPNPIIFAMANPVPEILPEDAHAVRSDAIIATGRSDYPNQVNNVLGFPYIFRGALDVRATTINEEMKIAAAEALADLARETVPDEVAVAYGKQPVFGPEYIIPAPFDPRLIEAIPLAVARAAMRTGVAQRPIIDEDAYRTELRARLNPTTAVLSNSYDAAKANPKRIVFAEGEEETVLRAAITIKNAGYGIPVLVGRDDRVKEGLRKLGVDDAAAFEIHNSRISPLVPGMAEYLYRRLQRKGVLYRDAQRMVNQDRNIFGALLVALGHGDVLVTGVTRHFSQTLSQVQQVIDPAPRHVPFGIHLIVGRSDSFLIADTTVNERPSAEQLADIAEQTASVARRMGKTPRVAFLSYSNFGNPPGDITNVLREAVAVLDDRRVGFEYEGEMSADVALNRDMAKLYPFSRLTGPANVLIMPGLHSANISAKLLKELGGGRVFGPLLMGMSKPVQIVPMTSTTSDLVTMAVLAASGVVD